MIKIVLLLVKNVFFSLNECISEKVCQVAQKHTATDVLFEGVCSPDRYRGRF